MKIKKKITLFLALVLLLSAVVFPASASAARIPSGNSRELQRLCRMTEDANDAIALYVKIAQHTWYNDINWVLFMVDLTVAPVFAYADRIGAEVVCEYETYIIDGRAVEIDPLRVININVED